MGRIRLLDDHIANQIAAGEVVERPSSVVKELVENSIDAGSTRIEVFLEEGGIQLIRVKDNGSGMEKSDVQLAFHRHATSKISASKDLFRIRSLGFRGEALPSIAAVAKVECVTSDNTSGLGTRIVVAGGQVLAAEEAAASRGTEITVRELFYNTPARLKYMKTIQTELGHVSDYMYRLALAHPGIAFSLKHNHNSLLHTLGNGDLLQVIAAVYGTSAAKQMLAVSLETPDYTISGYISRPEWTRANRYGISTIINGRYIRNYGLVQALLKGYHTLLPINRYPLAVLHLEMSPELVDVNVHPAKLEVRFSKEPELLQSVEESVRAALAQEVLIPEGRKPADKKPVVREQIAWYGDEMFAAGQQGCEAGSAIAKESAKDDLGTGEPGQTASSGEARAQAGVPQAGVPQAGVPAAAGRPDAARDQQRTPRQAESSASSAPGAGQAPLTPPNALPPEVGVRRSGPPAGSSSAPEPEASLPSDASGQGGGAGGRGDRPAAAGRAPLDTFASRGAGPAREARGYSPRDSRRGMSAASAELAAGLQPQPATAAESTRGPGGLPAFPALTPIGQLHGTYILAQNEQGLYLIDQHAAHERINYEYYYEKFGKPEEASQELLVPLTLEFTPAEAALLNERLDWFERVGVYMESFGGASFIVRAYPHWFPAGEEKELIEEMAEWMLTEKKQLDLAKLREKSSTLCSCKASIKANQALSIAEMETLIRRLAGCRIPYTCPHGRPIVVSFSTYELEKMFKRVM
ncbi:DNA mismatch repair endonuclease MutL [Paenibacillus senegalensis]|uniref:DNA mismatch repair endonuclease MutL n=1 Tax=Paenibacillus senegalensis TaxID=1465766 RepID=UPI000287B5B2|nr:DNA mismatch repair endonuclease MutL [Paenibacillus senegalensis]